jgi:ubiquinone/menaquinone biosynthesis C-methylase UbiE
MTLQIDYSKEPTDPKNHTKKYNEFYSRFAVGYDWLVKILPFWRNWIMSVLPWIHGPKVFEVSFGTGFLLTQYADRFTAYGVDHNWRFSKLTNC